MSDGFMADSPWMWVRVIMGMTSRFQALEKAEKRCEIGNTVLFEKRLYYVFSLQMNTLTC